MGRIFTMISYLSNGGLSKTFAILFQFLFSTGACLIAGWEILHSQAINPYLLGLIGVIAGHQITVYSGAVVTDVANKQATQAVKLLETQPPILEKQV